MQIWLETGGWVDANILVGANGLPVDFGATSASKSNSAQIWTVPANVANSIVLAANAARKGSPSIYYDGAAIMYVLIGTGVASATNYTIKLGAEYLFYYEPPVPNYTGAISAAWSAPVGNAFITEFM